MTPIPDVGATGVIWSERLPWSPITQHGLFRCECVARNRSWRTWLTNTGVCGDLDACELTDEDRERGVPIEQLIKETP